jgi:hypothetical protein
MLGRHALEGFRIQHAVTHPGGRQGSDGIGQDAVAAAFLRQPLHEADQTELRGVVVRLTEMPVETGRRGRDDDPAVPLLRHSVPDGLRAVDGPQKMNPENLLEIDKLHLREGLVPQDSGVVDQDVDPPERVQRLIGQACSARGTGDVIAIGDGNASRPPDFRRDRFGGL